MNQTLDTLARAIFEAWFLDFEPVRSKSSGAVGFRGMPGDVFDQLSDHLVESELGPIPAQWEVASLEKFVEINPKRSLEKSSMAPYLSMADMPIQGHAPEKWEIREYGSGMRFENGDTLVARITPCLENGKTAFVDFLPDSEIGWGSTEYIVLRPKAPLPAVYAYCLARSSVFRDFAIKNMTGTSGRQRVPTPSLASFRTVLPPEPIAVAFGALVEPIFAKAAENQSEIRTLAAIRDALLSKLISGEIRIPHSQGAHKVE